MTHVATAMTTRDLLARLRRHCVAKNLAALEAPDFEPSAGLY